MKSLPLQHAHNISSVPSIMFGAMGISEFYGVTDIKSVHATLEAALEAGINLIDTADAHGCGENEDFLKTALQLTHPQQREKIMIASKCGIVRDKHNPNLRGVNVSFR